MSTQALPPLKDGNHPFILINLRIAKEKSDFMTEKVVIRLGTYLDYQVTGAFNFVIDEWW